MDNIRINKLSTFGLNIAFIATALNIICDLLLYSGPAKGSDISDFSFLLPALASTPPLRSTIATGVGILFISTWFFTIPSIFILLGNVNGIFKYGTVIALVYFIGTSASYHGSYALLAGTGRLLNVSIENSSTGYATMHEASMALFIPLMISLVLFSLLFALSILSNKSKLPRWTAILSLFFFASIPPMLASQIPAPFGGSIAISSSTTGIAVYWGIIRILWGKYGKPGHLS